MYSYFSNVWKGVEMVLDLSGTKIGSAVTIFSAKLIGGRGEKSRPEMDE